ncbi:hypothetical protein L596_030466 [Steinernema carpocapsae]|uniref:Uncharacterized protein n=1 Tax=Steinernema carpocapsae TaxID=34508 RepID=A0A4U5LPG6_STECR|nr:hypothetical protein L596_030466 [Steinernema carpocapsae]
MLFNKGIPKMMQVADDMHRMTNYIQDLRNMTLGLGVIAFIVMFFFLIIKIKDNRRRNRRRRKEPIYAQRPSPYTSEPWERRSSNPTEKMRLSTSGSNHDFNVDHIHNNGGPVHKKHEPIRLMVEDLPYADS